jgi:hypothetical protein
VSPADIHFFPVPEVPIPTRCPGPAGTWPCALEFGHGGDHERFAPVLSETEKLRLENAELRSCLRVALPLLADWPFIRGASLRRSLIERVGKALR